MDEGMKKSSEPQQAEEASWKKLVRQTNGGERTTEDAKGKGKEWMGPDFPH